MPGAMPAYADHSPALRAGGRAPPACARSPSIAPDQVGDADIARLWREYKRSGSRDRRNELILYYMNGLVRSIAHRLHAQLPRQVEIEDLIQQSYDALADLIDRFDLSRDVRFETFSSHRIYGAMRDYLREIDPMPRVMRSQVKMVEAAEDGFRKEHGRRPHPEELRCRLELPPGALRKWMTSGPPPAMVEYQARGRDAGARGRYGAPNDADAIGHLEDRRASTPLRTAEHEDLRRWITRGFTRRDRLIIILYYFEQMTMKEIGETLGCSESRVSQRLDSILQTLRARLNSIGAEQEFYGK